MPIQGKGQKGKGEPWFQFGFINKNTHLHAILERAAQRSWDFSRWHGWPSRYLHWSMGAFQVPVQIQAQIFCFIPNFFFLSSWNKLKLHCPSKAQQGRIRKTWKEGNEWHLPAIFLPVYWPLLSLLSHLLPSHLILTGPTAPSIHLSFTSTLQHPQTAET